ncbi:MAG: fluoride efflux transporter CrcB [Actinobacteria bacterium]|nr:fluoride efflux transporter CrcB [Actinomycetota bacterium]
MTALLVLLGGAFGAPVRYLVDRALAARTGSLLPWGTFAVNTGGSLVLGTLAGGSTSLPGYVAPLLGVGFCGALTTYSTFGFETVRLIEDAAPGYALLNVAGNLAAGLAAGAVGYWAGVALVG